MPAPVHGSSLNITKLYRCLNFAVNLEYWWSQNIRSYSIHLSGSAALLFQHLVSSMWISALILRLENCPFRDFRILDRYDIGYSMFTCLSKVKHLSLGFNDFGIFGKGCVYLDSVQASCPRLRSLTFFPRSQIVGFVNQGGRHSLRPSKPCPLNFVNVDSNPVNWFCFRRDRC